MPWRSRSNEIRPHQRIAPAEDVPTAEIIGPSYTFLLLDASVLLGRDRSQRAEQAVVFALEADGEIQSGRGEPLEFSRNPRNSCVKLLKAAIQPLPKFPRRMLLLNLPKSRGVHTTPRGEFVRPVSVLQMALVLSARTVNPDKSIPGSRHVIVLLRVLVGVGKGRGRVKTTRPNGSRELLR